MARELPVGEKANHFEVKESGKIRAFAQTLCIAKATNWDVLQKKNVCEEEEHDGHYQQPTKGTCENIHNTNVQRKKR